ncbi:MAG: MarR family transcriptional regulator [Candidatus Micrarchaeia archaeon]
MKNKDIASIIAIAGGSGVLISFILMYLIPSSCPLVMEWYHQVLIFLIPLFFVIFALGVYLYLKPEEMIIKKVIKAHKIEKILTPEERKIIEYLRIKKNATQAEIRKELNYPRATLSMILSRMEKRKLIRKQKIGKTNYVILMKGF